MSLSIGKLAVARALHARCAERVKQLRVEWEKDFADELDAVKVAAAQVELMEVGVREEALAYYKQSGDRKGIAGAEVKLYETLAYTEPDAMAWAKESGMCLALDKKAFEKVAKATDLPFVTKGEEPRVSIASDLTPFIGNNE